MTKTAPLIDIREDHWDIVQGILEKRVPQYEVWAFGSRAKWTAKQYSDLDLAIITDKPLSLDVSASLSDDFSESDLPYKVDIVDWATTSESFRKIIEQDKVVMQKGKPSSGVANEWKITTLGEFVRLQRGHDLTAEERVPGYFPVMGSAGQNGTHGKFISPGPGVVIGRSGASMGCVHYVSSDYWPHNTCLYVTDFLGNDPRFTFYFLGTLNLASYNSGSAQPSLNRNFVYTRSITVPPPIEQRTIAHILGTLDDKIELNRKQNETLEAMARALFKAWFVDFEPVRAKMEGRWQRGQSLPGLPAHLYDLFPDRLVDSELGEIPEGWKIAKVETVLKRLPTNIRYTKNQVSNYGKTPVFEQGVSIVLGFHDGDAFYQASANDPAFIFGDHTCKTRLSCQPFDISQNVIPLRGHGRPTMWVYFAVNEKQKFEEYRRHWMELIAKDLIVASNLICLEFSKQVTDFCIQMEQSEKEARSLAQLRDTLLPKLISGELRVRDANNTIEDYCCD